MEAHSISCLCLSTAAKGAHDMSLKTFPFCLLLCQDFCLTVPFMHTHLYPTAGGRGQGSDTQHNDHPCYAKHVLAPLMCVLGFLGLACCGGGAGRGGGQFFTLYSPTIKKFANDHTRCAKHVLGPVYVVSTVFRHGMACRGFTFRGRGG